MYLQKDTNPYKYVFFYFLKGIQMENTKKINYEIKLPSSTLAVNKGSISKFMETISKAGSTKTLIDLEHFLRAKTPGKSPGYYQQGGRFVVDLLAEAGILEENGNQLTLRMEGSPSETKAPLVVGILNREAEAPLANNTRGTDNSLSINSSSYLVTIKGPGMNHHIEISEEIDFNILNAILGKVRTKISDTKDGKQ